MRIIAGKHKGRKLKTLEGLATRPMMDRMKESIFNILGPYFEGQIVLDLFGGSASLSLEAISRGCKFSHIVEISREAIKIIRENVSTINEESKIKIYNTDYNRALKKFALEKQKFDIIFLDPPFKLNVIDDIIIYLINNNMINENGYIVCQYLHKNYQIKEYENLHLLKNYTYAASEVAIYECIRKNS